MKNFERHTFWIFFLPLPFITQFKHPKISTFHVTYTLLFFICVDIWYYLCWYMILFMLIYDISIEIFIIILSEFSYHILTGWIRGSPSESKLLQFTQTRFSTKVAPPGFFFLCTVFIFSPTSSFSILLYRWFWAF